MDHNNLRTYRTDQPDNKLQESPLVDYSNEDVTPDGSPNLRQESERGTPEKDGASDANLLPPVTTNNETEKLTLLFTKTMSFRVQRSLRLS